MLNRRNVERHHKPIMGLRLRHQFAIFLTLALVLAVIIMPVALVLSLEMLIIILPLLTVTIWEFLPFSQINRDIFSAVDRIHEFYFENNLTVDDPNNLNYYLSPKTRYISDRDVIRAFCLSSKREEMLSQKTIDALQAYLDSFKADKLVKRAYYDNGYIIYELGLDIDVDRLDF